MHAKDRGINHVRVKLSLTLYKLTGWFASLDLQQALYKSHPKPLNNVPPCHVLVSERGRGKTMKGILGCLDAWISSTLWRSLPNEAKG